MADLSFSEYQILARRTLPSRMTREEMMLHAALGLAGEAGEVVDCLKKHLFQGHALETTKLAEEAGDLCWHLSELADALHVSLEEIARGNIAKLARRYPAGFTEADSLARVDTTEPAFAHTLEENPSEAE